MKKLLDVIEYFKEHPNIESEVKKLRDWLKLQPHLPEKYITDLDLVLAYNCSNSSPEITKNLLDVHYTFRTHHQIFHNFKYDEDVANALTYSLCTFLPDKRKDGFKCMYFKFINKDTKLCIFADAVKMFLMLLEITQYEEGTWPGLTVIIDLDNFTLAHITKLDLGQVRDILILIQQALMTNLKATYFINAPSFMDLLTSVLKPFLSAEIMNGIQIQTDGKIVGLDLENINLIALKDDCIRKMRDFEDVFKNSSKKVVDETKRPGKPKTINDVLGIQGSFKRIEID